MRMDIEEEEILDRMKNEPTDMDIRRSIADANIDNVYDSHIDYQSNQDQGSVIIQDGGFEFGEQLNSTQQQLILNQHNWRGNQYRILKQKITKFNIYNFKYNSRS